MPGKPRKLNWDQVHEIRRMADDFREVNCRPPYQYLARRFGVVRSTVYKIISHEIWRVSLVLLFLSCQEPDHTAQDAECVKLCADYPPIADALEFGCVCEGGKPTRSSSGFPYVTHGN